MGDRRISDMRASLVALRESVPKSAAVHFLLFAEYNDNYFPIFDSSKESRMGSSSRQTPVQLGEVSSKQVELLAYGETTQASLGGTTMPYKVHVLPCEQDGRLLFTQLVVSIVFELRQIIEGEQDEGGGEVIKIEKFRKVAVAIVITCFDEVTELRPFMRHFGFLRAETRKLISSCRSEAETFYNKVAKLRLQRELNRLLQEFQRNDALLSSAASLENNAFAFLHPVFSMQGIFASQQTNVFGGKEWIDGLLFNPQQQQRKSMPVSPGKDDMPNRVTVPTDHLLLATMKAVETYNSSLLVTVATACIALSDYAGITDRVELRDEEAASESLTNALPPPPHRRQRRIIILSEDLTLGRHLLAICAFFFRRQQSPSMRSFAAESQSCEIEFPVLLYPHGDLPTDCGKHFRVGCADDILVIDVISGECWLREMEEEPQVVVDAPVCTDGCVTCLRPREKRPALVYKVQKRITRMQGSKYVSTVLKRATETALTSEAYLRNLLNEEIDEMCQQSDAFRSFLQVFYPSLSTESFAAFLEQNYKALSLRNGISTPRTGTPRTQAAAATSAEAAGRSACASINSVLKMLSARCSYGEFLDDSHLQLMAFVSGLW